MKTHYVRSWFVIVGMILIPMIAACQPKPAAVGLTGHNHTKLFAVGPYSVNGKGGMILSPGSGGAGESCCVMLPRIWRKGLRAEVMWEYSAMGNSTNVPPPAQRAVVEIPEYSKPAVLNVHFYENHKVKLVVSPCSVEHVDYPLSEQDRLPWTIVYKRKQASPGKEAKNEC